MFFILSSGRSGSRTIADTFNQFRDCVCLHHPKPELVIEATEYLYGTRNREEIAAVLRETRAPTIRDKTYGEANLQLSLLVPILNELFPKCRFVWLLRDGRDAVASMYYRGWYDPTNGRIPEHWHRARLQGDRTGDYTVAQWQEMDRFQRCCWIWAKYNLVIDSHFASLGQDRWMAVRLDRLKATLPELASFLGLTWRRVRVERLNVAFQPVVYWESWTGKQRSQFDALCGPLMDRWFPEWRSQDGTWRRIDAEAPDHPGRWLVLKRTASAKVSGFLRKTRRLLRKANRSLP